MCNAKKCGQYPLTLSVEKAEELEIEYNEEFMKNILEKIDYDGIKSQSMALGIQMPDTIEECDLKLLHKYLMGIEVIEGKMTCDKCMHIFPIKGSIPNMLLSSSEV